MLKRKRDACYRRVITRWERCKYCAHRIWTPIRSCAGGAVLRHEWRCLVIGPESSRRYSIQDNHVCNGYEKNKVVP